MAATDPFPEQAPDAPPLLALSRTANDLLDAWVTEHAPDLTSRAGHALERAITDALEATWAQAARTGATTTVATMLHALAEHRRTYAEGPRDSLVAARIESAAALLASVPTTPAAAQ